ncbi:MAG: hypothetical protein ACI89U_001779 [Gammaproteobacteria bacterium]|jgi:hypothetical protein
MVLLASHFGKEPARMITPIETLYSAYEEYTLVSSGRLQHVAIDLKKRLETGGLLTTIVFDDTSSLVYDLDLSGSLDDVKNRYYKEDNTANDQTSKPKGRGRPKLGVVGHEVTLLPRHWEWLKSQPGGPSVALRKLVEQARHDNKDVDQLRFAQNTISRFMSTIAGNLPGFEEANRALFANDKRRFEFEIDLWPEDIKLHIKKSSTHAFPIKAPN